MSIDKFVDVYRYIHCYYICFVNRYSHRVSWIQKWRYSIVKVQQNSFFDATFYLNTSKCRHSPDWFRVKVLYYHENFSIDVCNVIYEHYICHITDMSSFCFCKNDSKKSVRLYREFKVSGNASYIWRLSESSNGHPQKKAQITFDVASK